MAVSISGSDDFRRYLPGSLDGWSVLAGRELEGPEREVFLGSLLLTDISGFTRLTARLCERDHGAEHVSNLLNKFMGSLVSHIEAHGGTVFGFGGDSLLAGWRARSPGALETTAWRSCYCAGSIRDEIRGLVVAEHSLHLRFAVGAGEIALLHLKPHPDQRRLVISGDCQSQVMRCGQMTDTGEILVSEGVWRLIEARSAGEAGRDGTVRLQQIESFRNDDVAPPAERQGTCHGMAAYLPSALRGRLQSPLAQWLAELRTVTAMFVHVTRPPLEAELESVDALVKASSSAVTLAGGEILDITMQASGLELFAVFGLPGETHSDNAKRAILAALRLSNDVTGPFGRPSIGIGTGETFCGALGAAHRTNYSVVGEAVNTASRLASVAAGRIFVDRASAHAARGQIDFEGPWPLRVPGIRGAVPAFVPLSAIGAADMRKLSSLVGRATELNEMLGSLEEDAGLDVMLLAGSPGVGKSALLRGFVDRARSRGFHVLLCGADEIERATPYFAWRSITRDLLGLGESRGQEAQRLVERYFEERPHLASQSPLLNDILDLTLPETVETRAMSGDGRARNLRRLLGKLIAHYVEGRRALLVLEDIHWLDDASGMLLGSLLDDGIKLRLMASTRTTASEADLKRWAGQAAIDIRTHVLQPLDFENTATLVRMLTGNGRLGQPEDFIYAQSGGNPFLIGEICRIMSERAAAGSERLSDAAVGNSASTNESTMLDTARSIVLTRTDSLPADCQVVLKLASAIGTMFRSTELQGLAPIRSASVDIDLCLDHLCAVDLIRPDPARPGRFTFAHAIIRTAVYESMLTTQRQEAHAAIASAMEEAGQPGNAESLPVILSHWERADVLLRAHNYLDRVAELRLRQFDNAAVIELTSRFLKLVEDGTVNIDQDRRTAASFMLAEANLNLGKVDAAKEGYKAGLRLAGVPIPESRASLVFHLFLDLAEQVFRRLVHWDPNWILKRELASPASERFMLASKAHEDLTRIYYFSSEKLRLLQAILRATNLAERNAFITPTTASNYASLGAICGVIPLRRQAEHYSRLGSALLERMENPGTRLHVHLLAGLYETSVGRWTEAARHFNAGTEQALTLGDMRRWCEHAVGLETISGPWLLTPAFQGVDAWAHLVERICDEGRNRGDIQVLGCGLVGGIRGYAALRRWEEADRMLHEFSEIVDRQKGLELVHCIEGASFLARAAFVQGDRATAERWLDRAFRWLSDLNPAMKTRTLPALVRLFEVTFEHEGLDLFRLRLVLAKLKRFARAIKVGGPSALRCGALLQAHLGKRERANRRALRAFDLALALEMPAEAAWVIERFPGLVEASDERRQVLARFSVPWTEALSPVRSAKSSPAS